MKKYFKIWQILIVIALIGFYFFYRQNSIQSKKAKEKKYTVKKQTLKDILSLSGKIDAEEHVTLQFQTSGKLYWVGVKEGDFVKKYQGIASLDQREVQKKLEKNLYDYSKERRDFEEDKLVTYKDKAITDTMRRVLEKNQFDLDKAVLDVELQNLTLEYTYLYTPIEGIVTKIDAPFAGVNVTPTGAQFEIVNPNTIFFSALADQTEVIKLRNGMTAEIEFDAYPETPVSAVIYSIAYTPKQGETGTVYEVKLMLPGAGAEQYRLGMTGDVRFVLKEKKGTLAIPTSFIRSDNGKKYVYVLKNGKQEKTFITLGEEIDGSTEILKGLSAQDIIVSDK